MKISKIVSIILIGVGALFIVFGCVFMFVFKSSSQQEGAKKDDAQEQIDEIYQIERNSSKAISKLHCLDNQLCMKDMSISFQYDKIGAIQATIVNQSSNVISDGYIKIQFILSDGTLNKIIPYSSLNPSDEVPLELSFTDSSFLKVKDYELVAPTEEEILDFQNSSMT